jgi:SRSO17 transposase
MNRFSAWSVACLQKRRLELILQQLNGRAITLVIDETGDRKKGNTTDCVARQYIGNLGKVENGIVSVNAYGIVEQLTFPLLFNVPTRYATSAGINARNKTERGF